MLLFAKLFVIAKVFDKLRLIKKKKIDNVITFTFFIIKIKYDLKHFVFDFFLKKKKYISDYIIIIRFQIYLIRSYYNKG